MFRHFRRRLVAFLAGGLLLVSTSTAAAAPAHPVTVLGSVPITNIATHQVPAFGAVWVLSQTEGVGTHDYSEVTKIDTRSNRVTHRLVLGRGPVTGDSVTAGGSLAAGLGAVWVVDFPRNQLIKIDPVTDQVVRRVRTAVGPDAVVAAFGSVWVAHLFTHQIWRYDPSTMRVTSRITAGVPNQYVSTLGTMTVGRGAVWVDEYSQHAVLKIAPQTNRITKINVGPDDPCGPLLFVRGGFWIDDWWCGSTIRRYDFATHTISATFTSTGCLWPSTNGHGAIWVSYSTQAPPPDYDCVDLRIAKLDPTTGVVLDDRSSPALGPITSVPDGFWVGNVVYNTGVYPAIGRAYHIATF